MPIDPSYFAFLAKRESGGRDNARAPTSSATGRYQFIDSTWHDLRTKHPELGLTPDGRTDPQQSHRAAQKLTSLNAAAIGRTDSPSLYLAHWLGAGRAKALLGASPDASVTDLLPPEVINANRWAFTEKKTGRPLKVGEVMAKVASDFGGNGATMRRMPAPMQVYDEQRRGMDPLPVQVATTPAAPPQDRTALMSLLAQLTGEQALDQA